MAFDRNLPFSTVNHSNGQIFFMQGGVFYNATTLAETSISNALRDFWPRDESLFEPAMVSRGVYGPDVRWRYFIGRRTAVANTLVDLWEGPTGTYVYPPAGGIQMQISSASAADTDVTGTGIQAVHIHYLDANYAIQEEVIPLAGVSTVNTKATNILRINSMHAVRVGSGGAAAGNISLKDTTGTTTYAFIAINEDSAHHGLYTVPAGYTCYIAQWTPAGGQSTIPYVELRLRATAHWGIPIPGCFVSQDIAGTLTTGYNVGLEIPIPVPEKMDIKLSAIADAGASANASATVMGWIEKN